MLIRIYNVIPSDILDVFVYKNRPYLKDGKDILITMNDEPFTWEVVDDMQQANLDVKVSK